MGILVTEGMGFLFTATMGFLVTMTLGIQFTVSSPWKLPPERPLAKPERSFRAGPLGGNQVTLEVIHYRERGRVA